MKTKLIAALIVGSFVLAGCGGGGSSDSAMDEEMQVADQERIDELEEELEEAQEEAAEAERLRQAAEAQRQQAEADRQRLEDEAEARRRADAAAATRRVIVGLDAGSTLTLGVGTIKYGAPAPVTGPTGPFTTTTGRTGQWSTTAHTASTGEMRDMVEIYSDVEAPTSVPFKDSTYNANNGSEVIDNEGDFANWYDLVAVANDGPLRDDTRSSSFDRVSSTPKSFDLVDRGSYTSAADRQNAIDSCNQGDPCPAEDERVRDPERYPLQYSVDVSGTLGEASGTFRCESASVVPCTVQNTGGHFNFVGPWTFRPSSATSGVRVADTEHMWFGWWARQTVEHEEGNPEDVHPTDDWVFGVGHGGNAVTSFTQATGTATYQGQAAGRYAVFEPVTGESSHGSFTASARLEANFGNATNQGTISGTIAGFSNDPDWSLALNQKTIDGGVVEAGTDGDDVTWSIDGVPDDSGTWEAGFYSNLPTGTPGLAQVQPHGIAGTFEAEYDGSGVGPTAAMIGAFGAHRPQ